MLNAGVLTFQEFVTHEALPLSRIHEAVLEFLRGRVDAVVFGAHAVNAYTSEPRMTQDVDVLATSAAEFVEEMRDHLNHKFHIALRVREVSGGKGFRLYQVQKTGNRHLVDVRPVAPLPPSHSIENILVLAPAELIASKVIAHWQRRGKPKSWTDMRDLAVLLLTFPELKNETGAVTEILVNSGVVEDVLRVWRELVAQEIKVELEDEDLDY